MFLNLNDNLIHYLFLDLFRDNVLTYLIFLMDSIEIIRIGSRRVDTLIVVIYPNVTLQVDQRKQKIYIQCCSTCNVTFG